MNMTCPKCKKEQLREATCDNGGAKLLVCSTCGTFDYKETLIEREIITDNPYEPVKSVVVGTEGRLAYRGTEA